ncbi:glycosyltransferase [Mucilaginibacter sp. ZB1P21]|uniref:Glycosyltransferase n=2 Tax=Mucilaginibacter glaciei TaxID=2772109 RepID=A0A926S7I2_9SPHI|nr:glycosyltransferase [Mucilaginibacter glaciei]
MSLPYFEGMGWQVEVVTVAGTYSDMATDELLQQSVPPSTTIHQVKAFSKKFTSKFGLGSIAVRSLWFYKQQVTQILKNDQFDLIYFSTTQFPLCILGAYWKKRFNVPYVIDMQDPWHSDYYMTKPKYRRPPKYWFAYRLNKYLEPIAIKNVDGLISVSLSYIDELKSRYSVIKNIPAAVITFGAFEPDLKIAKDNSPMFPSLLDDRFINIVYIGRGGEDLHKAIAPVFKTFKLGLENNMEGFSKIKFYFIGTSYAPTGKGTATILPLAQRFGIGHHVIEVTDRISYYHVLLTLQQANALFIPGSDDPQYTASKIFPYLLNRKLVLAIFNKASSAIPILQEYGVKHIYNYDEVSTVNLNIFFDQLINGNTANIDYNTNAVDKYSALEMTRQECLLFDQVLCQYALYHAS